MIKIYFKTASHPRGLDTNRKWSVSQNDQNVDTAFLLWGAELQWIMNANLDVSK